MRAAFVRAVTITGVPLVAFGGAHASEAYDDLAEEVAAVHGRERGRSVFELEHLVDDRLDLVLGQERIERLEIGARADVDAARGRVQPHQRADGHVAREPRQAADDRNMAAEAERLQRARQRVLAADLEHLVDARAAGQGANFVLPLGVAAVVHGAERAELTRARELRVARARDDRLRAGRGRELQAEHRDAARALEQHEVAGLRGRRA